MPFDEIGALRTLGHSKQEWNNGSRNFRSGHPLTADSRAFGEPDEVFIGARERDV